MKTKPLTKRHSGVAPGWYGQGLWPASLRATDAPGQCTRKMSKHQSADSPVRAFLASDQVRAEQAVRAPVSPFLERILCLTLLAQRSVALRGTAGLRFAMGSYLRSWTCLSSGQSDLDPDQPAGWKRRIHRDAVDVVLLAASKAAWKLFQNFLLFRLSLFNWID